LPRESRLKASLSPRMPVIPDPGMPAAATGFSSLAHCRVLEALMQERRDDGAFPPDIAMTYYHRYLHGDLTVAAAAWGGLSFGLAGRALLVTCYLALVLLAATAIVRLQSPTDTERRRAAAFLIIAAVLAAFSGLAVFGHSVAAA